jgi:hypothetical protein
MEMRGQLHTWPLIPEKELRYPSYSWATEPIWRFWRRKRDNKMNIMLTVEKSVINILVQEK